MKKIIIIIILATLIIAGSAYAYQTYDNVIEEIMLGAGGTFPTTLPTYTAVVASSPLTGHADDHNQLHTDVTALATKMGTGSSDASSASANEVLTADGSGGSSWAAVSGGSGAEALGDLSDVATTTDTVGYVLKQTI